MHRPEGAFFLWLWIDGLKISSNQLYQKLKAENVFVIPGEEFFIDIDSNWQHTRECIRINYAQPIDKIDRGFTILAKHIREAI